MSINPYYIPGYAGCCPKYKYRIADIKVHKILLDPTAHHAETVLSDRSGDNYKTVHPSNRDLDIVSERQGNTIYKHPMVPGYDGFVPNEHAKFGQSYTTQATEAISDFEVYQNQDKAAVKKIFEIKCLQDKQWDPQILEEEELDDDEIDAPFVEPILITPNVGNSHYLSDYNRPDKYLKSGYTGHVPFNYECFGNTYDDFTSHHSKKKGKEGVLIPVLVQPLELYQEKISQSLNYMGHPSVFLSGKTYELSKDEKRTIKGDPGP